MEPRHYGGVFGIQEGIAACDPFLKLFFRGGLFTEKKRSQKVPYLSTVSAMASTSTRTFLGRVFTATQERAGQSPVKKRA